MLSDLKQSLRAARNRWLFHGRVEGAFVRDVAAATLRPIGVFRTKGDWDAFVRSGRLAAIKAEDRELVDRHGAEAEWSLPAISYPAGALVPLKVDQKFGGENAQGRFVPNLRERLVCPVTRMNNRQRLVATLLERAVADRSGPARIHLFEQVTPIYRWARRALARHEVSGSEYLGDGLNPGALVKGLRHEDLHRLSFGDASIDVVVSNDVMEHVASPSCALSEIQRVLRPGGCAMMTFPFARDCEASVRRAELGPDGKIAHLLEPAYHGNPLSKEGSLVFTDFGWDLLAMARDAGFQDVTASLYHAPVFGHLGDGLLVFTFAKAPAGAMPGDATACARR